MTNSREARVLLLSQRNIAKDAAAALHQSILFRCPHYECEDIICQIDSVDLVAPGAGRWFIGRYEATKRVAFHSPVMLNPGVAKVKASRTYDLLFAIFGSAVDVLLLKALGDWQKVARRSICLIDEMWVRELRTYRFFMNTLAKFDCVMLYYSESVDAVNDAIGGRGRFLAPGIDALLFCPYPGDLKRVVDIYSIGRRSEATHQALLKLAKEQGRFYLHDSVSGSHAFNATEHRLLFANIAKRSRYFIVNPALIDRQDVRGNQSEMGSRYFEGAAAGAIMIGERPSNKEFKKMFDWPDAVLDLPYGSVEIGQIINEVESKPRWEETMRRNNVVQALLRHDWAYRWEAVLCAAELKPLQGLLDRKSRLERLAKEVAVSGN
jgi:Glycosyl transferases group 1